MDMVDMMDPTWYDNYSVTIAMLDTTLVNIYSSIENWMF